MTPAEILGQWKQRQVDAESMNTSAPVADIIGAFLRDLESLQDEPDRLVGVPEAAALLGSKPRWIYDHSKTLPFVRRIGKQLRCSSKGIAQYLEMRGNG